MTTCEDSVVLEVVDDYLGIYGLTLSQKLLEQSQYGRESSACKVFLNRNNLREVIPRRMPTSCMAMRCAKGVYSTVFALPISYAMTLDSNEVSCIAKEFFEVFQRCVGRATYAMAAPLKKL